MNAEVKDRWVRALRSGKYTQTKFRLSDNSGDCCLGVLCKIAEEDQVVFSTHEGTTATGLGIKSYQSKVDSHDYETAVLPGAVVTWSELVEMNPILQIPQELIPTSSFNSSCVDFNGMYSTSLADLNDDHNFTFEQIADIVEKYL